MNVLFFLIDSLPIVFPSLEDSVTIGQKLNVGSFSKHDSILMNGKRTIAAG